MACQGNPPVHTGSGLLEFGTTISGGSTAGVTRTTRLSLYTAAPFDHWGYHASALVGETDSTGIAGSFDLTDFPLHPSNDGTSEPFMRYTSAIPFWRHGVLSGRGAVPHVVPLDLHDQHEILIFARDPAEQAATVRAVTMTAACMGGVCDLAAPSPSCSSNSDCSDVEVAASNWLAHWQGEWAFGRSPFVPRMMYPWQPNLTTLANGNTANPPDLIAGVVASDFWPGTPTGPGAAPDGSGSIKAVKIVNHGVCGVFQPYVAADGSGILQTIIEGLPKAVLQSAADNNDRTCNTYEEKFAVGASYLDLDTDQEDAQHGGIVIGTHVQLHSPTIFNGGPNILMYFKEAWRLFDGRLTADGEMLGFGGQGTDTDTVHIGFDSAFTREMDAPLPPGAKGSTLAESIWAIAYNKQRFTGIAQVQGTPFIQCTARPDARVIANDPTAPCASFVSTYGAPSGLITTALGGVGTSVIGLNADEQAEVLGEFQATEKIGNDTVWKNIRCADLGDKFPVTNPPLPNAGQPTGPVCYYEAPAKRLNVYPDGVELVFLDQLKELDNPVYPIWLMLLELEAEGQTPTLSPLCDDAMAEAGGSIGETRAFQTVAEPFDVTFGCVSDDATACNGTGLQGCCCDFVGPLQ